MSNQVDIDNKLRIAQRDSKNPQRFEKLLTEVFKELFGEQNVQHTGGPDAPDILIQINDKKIIVNAKTTDKKSIAESQIRWDVDEKHRKNYGAERVVIVGTGFSEGNIREFAKQRGVILIETESICKIHEYHRIKPYERSHLYDILFGGEGVISPDKIEPSTKVFERKLNILKAIIDGIHRDGKVTYKDVYHHLHFLDSSYQENEVRDAFEFLSQPLLIIRQEKESEYKPTLSTDELKERIWLLAQLFLEPSIESVPLTKPRVPPSATPAEGNKNVFFNYKRNKYEAIFIISTKRILYEGELYSPSTAAHKITGTSINGWKAWKFIDEQGKEQSIDTLRKKS